MTQLKELAINNTKISNAGWKRLVNLKNLKIFMYNNNEMDSEGIRGYASLVKARTRARIE
jgi:hypothetical protein